MALSKLWQRVCLWCGQFTAYYPDATLSVLSMLFWRLHKVHSLSPLWDCDVDSEKLVLQEMKKKLRDEYLGFGGAPNQVSGKEPPQVLSCTGPGRRWCCCNATTAYMTR